MYDFEKLNPQGDIEQGTLYPGLGYGENELRWGFIRKAFCPHGSTSVVIYGGISAMIFSGYIVYDTDNLIKRFTYDEYIWASVALYLDILNLFIVILLC